MVYRDLGKFRWAFLFLFASLLFSSIAPFSAAKVEIDDLKVFGIDPQSDITNSQLARILTNENNKNLIEFFIAQSIDGMQVDSFLKRNGDVVGEALGKLLKKLGPDFVAILEIFAKGYNFRWLGRLVRIVDFVSKIFEGIDALRFTTRVLAEGPNRKLLEEYVDRRKNGETPDQIFESFLNVNGEDAGVKATMIMKILCLKKTQMLRLRSCRLDPLTEQDYEEFANYLEFQYQNYLVATDPGRHSEIKEIIVDLVNNLPEAPSNLELDISKSKLFQTVTLIWQDNSDDEIGFKVKRDGFFFGAFEREFVLGPSEDPQVIFEDTDNLI